MLRVVGAVLLTTGAVVLVILTTVTILQFPFCSPVGTYTFQSYFLPQNDSTRTFVSVGFSELHIMPSEGFRYTYRPKLAVEDKSFVHCYIPHLVQWVTVNQTLIFQRGRVYLIKLSDRALVEPLLHSPPEIPLDEAIKVLEKKAVVKAELSESKPAATWIYSSGFKLYEATLEVEPGAYYVVALLLGEVDQPPFNCTISSFLRGLGWLEGSVCKVASPTPAQLVRCLAILALGILLLDYDLRLEGESLAKRISRAFGALRRVRVVRELLKRRGSTS